MEYLFEENLLLFRAMQMYENRPVKLACKWMLSYIYMARSTHKQKESLVEAILRMRALNS